MRLNNPPAFPKFWEASIASAQVLVGAAFQYNLEVVNYMWQNCYVLQNPGANGDSFGWYATLSAGTYKVGVWYDKNGDRGIQVITIGSVSVGSLDNYAAVFAANQLSVFSGVIIPADGTYLVKSVINGKNGASTGFAVTNQRWFIIQ